MFFFVFFKLLFRLNDEEILDLLMKDYDCDKESDSEIRCTVEIVPPIEDCNAMTDCDSDESYNEVTCNPDHLHRCILLSEVIANKKKNA